MKLEKLNNLNQKCVIRTDECGEFFLSCNGGVYQINEISYEIVINLNEGLSVSEIINNISQKYNVACDEVNEDVLEFIEKLKVLRVCD